MGSNGLVGQIPKEIFDLPNLKTLSLYSNAVEFSFDGIGQATNLEVLSLDSTKLNSLNGVGAGLSLVEVDVRFNQLSGPIPEELSSLSIGRSRILTTAVVLVVFLFVLDDGVDDSHGIGIRPMAIIQRPKHGQFGSDATH